MIEDDDVIVRKTAIIVIVADGVDDLYDRDTTNDRVRAATGP